MTDYEEMMQHSAEDEDEMLAAAQDQPAGAAQAQQPPAQAAADQGAPQQQPEPPQHRDFRKFCIGDRLAAIRQRFEDGEKFPAIATGHKTLDDLFLGGLRAGLYVLSAVPSWGKSAFALQIADAAAAAGRDVLYITIEMSTAELVARSISREMYLDCMERGQPELAKSAAQITFGSKKWTAAERESLDRAWSRYAQYAGHIYIFEDVLSVDELRDVLRDFREQTPKAAPPLLIVDYLQIMRAPSTAKSTVDGLDMIATELKRLSRDSECPLFVLSSVNRDSYKGTGGTSSGDSGLASGRGSGAIEFSADVLMLGTWTKAIYSPRECSEYEERRKDPREVSVRVLKNRIGRCGQADFQFRGAHNHFFDKPFSVPHFDSVLDENGQPRKPVKRSSVGRSRKGAGAKTYNPDTDEWESEN